MIRRPALFFLLLFLVAACAQRPGSEGGPYQAKSFFIFFATDSSELTPEAQAVLDRVAEEVRAARATGVGIVGYASPPGAPARNLRLSDERATAVEVALLVRQVPRDIVVRTHQGAVAVIGPDIEGQRVEIVVSREDRRR